LFVKEVSERSKSLQKAAKKEAPMKKMLIFTMLAMILGASLPIIAQRRGQKGRTTRKKKKPTPKKPVTKKEPIVIAPTPAIVKPTKEAMLKEIDNLMHLAQSGEVGLLKKAYEKYKKMREAYGQEEAYKLVKGKDKPIHAAALGDHPEVIEYILSVGESLAASPEYVPNPLIAKGVKNRTPLHVAALHDELRAVQGIVSIAGGGSPAPQNEKLRQAIYYVVNIKDEDGNTPIHLSSSIPGGRGHKRINIFLAEHGADLSAKNNKNQDPLDIARANNNWGTYWELKKRKVPWIGKLAGLTGTALTKAGEIAKKEGEKQLEKAWEKTKEVAKKKWDEMQEKKKVPPAPPIEDLEKKKEPVKKEIEEPGEIPAPPPIEDLEKKREPKKPREKVTPKPMPEEKPDWRKELEEKIKERRKQMEGVEETAKETMPEAEWGDM